jgi:hypothetical protein
MSLFNYGNYGINYVYSTTICIIGVSPLEAQTYDELQEFYN